MAHLDKVEAAMLASFPPVVCRVDNIFTPGLYTRIVHMPAGSAITSKIHKTQHPFTVLKGRCMVSNVLKPEEVTEIVAPYFGVTEPGTRRLLLILEDTVWATFHPTAKTTVEEVEAEIIQAHENPLLNRLEAA